MPETDSRTIDEATIASLIAQHGPNVESFKLDCLDYEIAIRPPKVDEWRLFRDESTPFDARFRTLTYACLVHPTREQIAKDAETRPGLLTTIGNEITAIAGFQGEVKRKKLQLPNGKQK